MYTVIGGASAGGVVALLLIVALGFFLCRRRRQRHTAPMNPDFEIDPSLKSPVESQDETGWHNPGALRRVATYVLQTSRVWSTSRSRSGSTPSVVPVESPDQARERDGDGWLRMTWRSPSVSSPSRRSFSSYIFPSPGEGSPSWRRPTSWMHATPSMTNIHPPPAAGFFHPEKEKNSLLLDDSLAFVNGVAPWEKPDTLKTLARPSLVIQTHDMRDRSAFDGPGETSVSHTSAPHRTSPHTPLPRAITSSNSKVRQLPTSPPAGAPQTPIIAAVSYNGDASPLRPLSPQSTSITAATPIDLERPPTPSHRSYTADPMTAGTRDGFGGMAGTMRKGRASLSARPMGPRQATIRPCTSVPRQVQSAYASIALPDPSVIRPDVASRRNTFGYPHEFNEF